MPQTEVAMADLTTLRRLIPNISVNLEIATDPSVLHCSVEAT
jgi:hypothetical protein